MATTENDIEQQNGKRSTGVRFMDSETNGGDADHPGKRSSAVRFNDDVVDNDKGPMSYSAHLKSQRTMKSRRQLTVKKIIAEAGTPVPDNELDGSFRAMHPKRTLREQKTMRHLGALTRRKSVYKNGLQSNDDYHNDDLLNMLDNFDEDGHFLEGDHDAMLPFYDRPLQRQRWGEDQILPHVNWGDLFFDLFYVGMAYNLGVMLMSAMNAEQGLRGIIYYFGTFGPLWISWERPMHYASRYTTIDYSHRLFEVVRYLFVSTAIMHISPVDKMSDSKSTETLIFTIAIFLESLMLLALHCEVCIYGQGDRESIKNHTLGHIKCHFIPNSLLYLAAMIVSIDLYIKPDQSYRRLASAAENYEDKYASDAYSDKYATDTYPDEYAADSYSDKYSYKAESAPVWDMSDLPLTLTAIAFLVSFVTASLRKVNLAKTEDVRKSLVPSNTDYVIHRYGEWVLLMIGEGILSLLIVETTESTNYYLVSTFGVLTMIFIQILKFESEPSHAEGHALWKNLRNAMCYSYLIQVLSMGLIVFGVTYKVFLKDVVKEKEKESGGGYGYSDETKGRMLAAAVEISDEAAANVFSVSIVVVLLALELMNLTHCGLKKALRHLVRAAGDTQAPHWPVIFVSILKLGALGFAATLSQWTTEPEVLTICGFAIVFCTAATRVLNYFLIYKKGVLEQAAANLSRVVRESVAVTGFDKVAQSTVTGIEKVTPSGVKMVQKSVLLAVNPSKDGEENNFNDEPETAPARRQSSEISEATGSAKRRSSVIDSEIAGHNFDAVVVADLHGHIIQVNDITVEMFAYSNKKELIGKNISVLCGGGDGKLHNGYMKSFKHKLETDASANQSKVLGKQRMLHGRRADGTEFPCVIGIRMVQNNTKIVGFIRDMSGFVSSEKTKIHKSMEEEYAVEHVVDDHAFDAIVAFNNTGVIKGVNKRALSEFGYESKTDLEGHSISVLFHGALDNLFEDSHGEQRLEKITKKDGTEIPCIVATQKKDADLIALYIRNLSQFSSNISI